MKRFISLILALCLIFTITPGVCQVAWADSEDVSGSVEAYLSGEGSMEDDDVISDVISAADSADSSIARSNEALGNSSDAELTGSETEVIGGGQCGDDLTWTLYEDGLMIVSGTGPMWDYDSENFAPWHEDVTSVMFDEGVTTVGRYAFGNCRNLTEVIFPSTLANIYDFAFLWDDQIQMLEFPESLWHIGKYAFQQCDGIQLMLFYGDAPVIDEGAFWGDAFAAYYDDENETWKQNSGTDSDCRQHYGGRVCWASWAADPDLPERMAGLNRQATATAISRAAFGNGTENIVIASGNNYPDALAGGPLAYLLGAPILLVSKSQLDADTVQEIDRLGAKHAYILGGPGAVGENVANDLRGMGLTVDRIAGNTRFETATAVAKKIDELRGGKPHVVFFVYANNYPDALAITGSPILYIEGNGKMRDTTKAYMDSCGRVDASAVIGGPALISLNAESELGRYGYVERIYGNDRYETCIYIDVVFRDILTGDSICLACGTNYPDALAGSVFAASCRAPLLLVRGNRLTQLQGEYLAWKTPLNVFAFGGTGALT